MWRCGYIIGNASDFWSRGLYRGVENLRVERPLRQKNIIKNIIVCKCVHLRGWRETWRVWWRRRGRCWVAGGRPAWTRSSRISRGSQSCRSLEEPSGGGARGTGRNAAPKNTKRQLSRSKYIIFGSGFRNFPQAGSGSEPFPKILKWKTMQNSKKRLLFERNFV